MTETIPFEAADGAVRPYEEVPVVDLSATGLSSTPLQQAMALAREHARCTGDGCTVTR